jgi:multidrug efflux pump
MKFTDIFIRRPVLASVVSLLILVLGIRAFMSLPVLEYPKTENAVITVTTTYYGADAQTMAGFITTPLENAISQANGIDYMSSVSQAGLSTISLNLRLNYDSNRAMTEVNAKINSVIDQLPSGTQQPVMTVKVGQSLDALIIGFASDQLGPNQITDYLTRNVQPALQAVPGVQTAEFLGPKNFALRAWLDPQKLAAYKLTASDVSTALANNDYIAGIGATKGQMIQVNLTASTSLHTAQQFRDLVLTHVNGGIVRLGDVANVVLGSDDYDSGVSFDGRQGVYIGIQTVPSANLLSVINGVKAVMPSIQAQLPAGLTSDVIYDSTDFVNSSIREVAVTLAEALGIVTLVVFAFLGSPRSVVIPLVAIPLSLVGTFAMMLLFGFSVNLLTLLALVLAIGLVVDDAIIVVESVNRHLEEGMAPFDAAIRAARDLASPIIAMTVVLVAVYVPIGFQSGLTGALFTEFAFTLVGAVTISAIIALTLSPMMCSILLKPHRKDGQGWGERLTARLDRIFGRLRRGYERALASSLRTLPITLIFTAIVLSSIYFLYTTSDSELAPQEDQGVVILLPTASPDATLQQKMLYGNQVEHIMTAVPEAEHTFQVYSPAMSIAGVTLKPWDQRTRNATTIQRALQHDLGAVAGQRIVAFQPAPLPGADGLPIQFVLKSTEPLDQLNTQAQAFLGQAQRSGLFLFLDSDLKVDLPQIEVNIDRDKAAQLGLNMNQVGTSLASLLGGGYVNYFSLASRSYKVIPQVQQTDRLNGSQVLDYQVATVNDVPVPLSAIATLKTETVPETLNHFQQINSATISGVASPGVTQGQALRYLQDLATRTLPSSVIVDYAGQLRQFVQESSGFVTTFAFALIIIFLSLAALFESFRDPLIILISVPMSIAGAMVFINLGIGGATLNIYTEVGLVTLMGLISKHGILMVEVANEEQAAGKSKLDAIIAAAGIRLRPILMTTAAMVLGVIPLIIASGAGAASRFNMGLVIAAGLSIGTLFTLFVVPAVYVAIAARHKAHQG